MDKKWPGVNYETNSKDVKELMKKAGEPKPNEFTRPLGTKETAKILLLGGIMLFGFYACFGTSDDQPKATATSNSSSSSKKNESGPKFASIDLYEGTCLEIVSIFGSENQYTDLQKEEMWKRYQGKVFQWNVRVMEISSGFLSGFRVQAVCQGSNSFIQDVFIEYPEKAKESLMTVKVGSMLKVKGRLKYDMGTMLGVTAEGILE